jgi:hypothetical protein
MSNEDDLIVRIPRRLRPAVDEITRAEFRRNPADTVRAIVEKEIFNRAISRNQGPAPMREPD